MTDSGRSPSGQAAAATQSNPSVSSKADILNAEPIELEGTPEPMPPKMQKFVKKYERKHTPGKIYRRKAKGMRGSVSKKRALAMCEAQGWKCPYCQRHMTKKAKPNRMGLTATVDHVTPISRGGKNNKGNLVMCCHRCNQSKGNLTADEFLAARNMPAGAYHAKAPKWAQDPFNNYNFSNCSDCGEFYEVVRPGKSQPTCDCHMICPTHNRLEEYRVAPSGHIGGGVFGYVCVECHPPCQCAGCAKAIETGTDKTEGLGPKDDSAVGETDLPNPTPKEPTP